MRPVTESSRTKIKSKFIEREGKLDMKGNDGGVEACPTPPVLRCYFWENVNGAVIVQPRCVCVCVRAVSSWPVRTNTWEFFNVVQLQENEAEPPSELSSCPPDETFPAL